MNRRRFLRNGSLVLGGAGVAGSTWSLGSESASKQAGRTGFRYPPARKEPVRKSIGGVEWTDDYAWLQQETPEALAWQSAQHEFAGSLLRDGPEFDHVRRRLDSTGGRSSRMVAPVRNRGGRWFVHRRESDADRLLVSDTMNGQDRVLLGPERLRELLVVDDAPRIAGFEPSPDGTVLGFAIDGGTVRHGDWRFLEVDSGRLLELGYSGDFMFERPEWFADSSGFFQPTRTSDGLHAFRPRIVDPARAGLAGQAKPITLAAADLDIGFNKLGQLSPDGRYLLVSSFTPTPRKPYWLVDTRTGGKRAFLPDDHDAVVFGAWGDDRHFVALDFRQAERGRIVEIPVDTSADASTWRQLVAESDLVLRAVTVCSGRLFVCALEDASQVYELYSRHGRKLARVPSAPFAASVTSFAWRHLLPNDAFVFEQETFDTASASYVYDESTETVTVVGPAPRKLPGIAVERHFAEAADGVRIPYFVARSASAAATGPAPALVYAYGGGNIAWLPTFLWQYQPFIEAGGVYVHPILRGGGEYGDDWAARGNREHKQRCFDDLYAVAEHAIESGVTTPAQLALSGESNGGMTAGAALTQRPELWAAVIPRFPVLDGLEPFPFTHDPGPNAAYVPVLHGDANDPEFAKIIAAYSPYQNIRDGERYPAVLLMLGLMDPLCLPANGRRMIARLQAANASTKPVIARFYDDTGHDFAADEALAKAQIAEYLAFAMRHTGLEVAPG